MTLTRSCRSKDSRASLLISRKIFALYHDSAHARFPPETRTRRLQKSSKPERMSKPMSAPTQLNVTITQNAGGTITTSVVVVPISAGLQALDSTTPGSTQTGHSAADELIRNIFRAR